MLGALECISLENPQVTSSATFWISPLGSLDGGESKPGSQVVPIFRQPLERITRGSCLFQTGNRIWSYTSEMASWVTYSKYIFVNSRLDRPFCFSRLADCNHS